MPDRSPAGPVNEQDLHLRVGAYDEVHHAHGYRWAPERHHWYWFAGIAASVICVVCLSVIYVLYERGMSPLCSRESLKARPSPGGDFVAELTEVRCAAGGPVQRVVIYATGGTGHVPAVASFDAEADVSLRWDGDSALELSKTSGRIWNFRPHQGDVSIRYATR